jgi:hypothetical protein
VILEDGDLVSTDAEDETEAASAEVSVNTTDGKSTPCLRTVGFFLETSLSRTFSHTYGYVILP